MVNQVSALQFNMKTGIRTRMRPVWLTEAPAICCGCQASEGASPSHLPRRTGGGLREAMPPRTLITAGWEPDHRATASRGTSMQLESRVID